LYQLDLDIVGFESASLKSHNPSKLLAYVFKKE